MGGLVKKEKEVVWNKECRAGDKATVLGAEKEQYSQIRP